MEQVQDKGDLGDLFGRLPVALYRTSPTGRVLTANAATAELLGFETLQELLDSPGAAEEAYVDPRGREAWRKTIEKHGIVRDFLTRLRRRNGEIIWVRDTARAVPDAEGTIRFYEGVLIDVTSEVRATNSTAVLAGVLETTTDFAIVFDEGGQLRYLNAAARRFLGHGNDSEAQSAHFEEILPNRSWRATFGSLAEAGRWSGEMTLRDHKGNRVPIWVVATVHEGRDHTRYVSAIARDLTSMKNTQRQLEELVTAKDVFVATVSHELRNPLAGVVGLAEEMRDRFDDFDAAERHDLITLIAHQAADMATIVDDLLVAIRSDVGEIAVVPERVDIGALLTSLATAHDGVTVDMPDDTLWAWVDPQRFRQIIRNLLSNAERYGGKRVRLTAGWVGENIAVAVSDDGYGVGEDDVERIFEPYQRADGNGARSGSVGLGLSVARRLARLMGGEVRYFHDGEWATFEVLAPAEEHFRVEAG